MTNRTVFGQGLLAAGLLSGLAAGAQAQGIEGGGATAGPPAQAAEPAPSDFTVYAGVALTSNYISDGVTQTEDGPALQPYIEFESSNGFYAGAWASNVSFEGDDDNIELDLYLGYRGEMAGGLAYDIGYFRYIYDDSGDCCGELIGKLTTPVTDAISVESYAALDPESEDWSLELSPEFAVNDALSVSGTLGYKDSYEGFYGDVGATWSFNDTTSFDVRYTDAEGDDADGIFYATVSFDTTLFGR